jgi:DNA polymerase
MSHDDELSMNEMLRRFVVQRRELGDGLWPKPSWHKQANAPRRATPPPLQDRVAERAEERYDQPPPEEPRSSRPSVTKPPSPRASQPPAAPERGIVAPAPQASLLDDYLDMGRWEGLTLEQFEQEVRDCRRCVLWETRTNLVFGEGSPNAGLMFIGEAPGEEEDKQGRPFVGRAGQLLTRMIEAMKLRREDLYIANVLKSRPPNNRSPLPGELKACTPYLEHQIRLIRPKIICALGLVAARALLQTNESLTRLRGRWHDYQGIKTIVTFHPAALLRNPAWKRESWDDLKKIRRELDGVEL